MKSFDSSRTVTNPDELFGRELLLDQLTAHVKRNNIVQVIGLRRYGKTSLLKCLELRIKQELIDRVIPFYIDFKEEGAIVKGTPNVYRYLISRVCQQLTKDGILGSELNVKNVNIKPCDNWEDCYDNLENVKDVRLQGLFKEIICWFSEYSGCTFYFLFDEYEHLFRFVFDTPQGFMAMRSLSSQTLNNGLAPFGFIISGTLTFENLCTLTGSGELNVISDTMYVPPIDYKSFVKMWNYECQRDNTIPKDFLSEVEFYYSASGGVPFYGKLLGESWLISGKRPDYLKLKSYFEEVLNGLSTEEKQVLKQLNLNPKELTPSIYRDELLRKGLIGYENKDLCISSKFFREFLSAKKPVQVYDKERDNAEEISKKVDIISNLIVKVNNTCSNKGKEYIFSPSNDDTDLFLIIRKPCPTLDAFSDFANSMYKIVFERTKGKPNPNKGKKESLWNLPDEFRKNNQFINAVDIMRHSLGGAHLMDHFEQRPGKMAKGDMLLLLTGSKNEPHSLEDFISLQLATLKMFEKELQTLLALVQGLS